MKVDRVTIRMPKKLLAAWLEALRSGKYKQGKGLLYNPETNSFCCLGVLEDVADGFCEPLGLPSREWRESHNIEFMSSNGRRAATGSPYLPSLGQAAHAANDFGGKDNSQIPFADIADAIEACAEGI